ncbi:uncharacterized protein isoform X2 [Musca autumnalis]
MRCAQIYGATEDDLNDVFQLKPAASYKMKCFRACVFTECKSFTNDGTFVSNIPQTTAFLTSRKNASNYEIVEEIAEDCVYKLTDIRDVCELTDQFLQCIGENTPEGVTLEGSY